MEVGKVCLEMMGGRQWGGGAIYRPGISILGGRLGNYLGSCD
jgi:hypothetical protein